MKKTKAENFTLNKIANLPEVKGKYVIAISLSGEDQLKVSVAKATNSKYIEERVLVTAHYNHALRTAKIWRELLDTSFVYEIRVFKDKTVETIQII